MTALWFASLLYDLKDNCKMHIYILITTRHVSYLMIYSADLCKINREYLKFKQLFFSGIWKKLSLNKSQQVQIHKSNHWFAWQCVVLDCYVLTFCQALRKRIQNFLKNGKIFANLALNVPLDNGISLAWIKKGKLRCSLHHYYLPG